MSDSYIIAVIDTNCLIRFFKNQDNPKQRELFLNKLKELIENRRILLIKPIIDELNAFKIEDNIKIWIKDINPNSIINTKSDQEIVANTILIMNYIAESPYYTDASRQIWEEKTADPTVIATVMKYGCAVFTFEKGKLTRDVNKPTSREPKIINICEDLNVKTMNLETFLFLTGLEEFY